MAAALTVNVTRGGIVESRHSLTALITDENGQVLESWGDIDRPIYPRSAIKALQALALIEGGGIERFKLSGPELALICASHNGEPRHRDTALALINRLGLSESHLECGHHWPMQPQAAYELAATGETPKNGHNNCSGKHAGMLALAAQLGVDPKGYIEIDHPVQQTIAKTIGEMCDVNAEELPVSPDGCSAPTWAMPLANLALGFARFAQPEALPTQRAEACRQLFHACVSHPEFVAGRERYCTDMMRILAPDVFLKVGAEGVYVACIPKLGRTIALKCDDGATRAAESAMTALLDKVGATQGIDEAKLSTYRKRPVTNWNKRLSGHIECESG